MEGETDSIRHSICQVLETVDNLPVFTTTHPSMEPLPMYTSDHFGRFDSWISIPPSDIRALYKSKIWPVNI